MAISEIKAENMRETFAEHYQAGHGTMDCIRFVADRYMETPLDTAAVVGRVDEFIRNSYVGG